MIKFLRIIVLCCFPLWVSAEPAIKQELIRFDAEMTTCRNTFLKQTCDEPSGSCILKNIRINHEAQKCYQQVLNNLLEKYYNLNAEQARQFSEKVIYDINEEYRSAVLNSKYCFDGCGRLGTLIPLSNAKIELQEYLFTLMFVVYHIHLDDWTFMENYWKQFMDGFCEVERPETDIDMCKRPYKDKVCSDYQNEVCIKQNLNIIHDIKECYSKYVVQLLQEHYNRTENQAVVEAQNIWNGIEKRHQFLVDKNIYADKETPLTKELNIAIATLNSFQSFIQSMEHVISMHSH